MLRRRFDVVTVGSATVDAFIWSKAFRTMRSDAFATGIAECFSLGSKIEIDRFVLATGGGATNAAATFAGLGLRTACIAATGADLFAEGVRKDLAARTVDVSLMQERPREQTAFSTILVIPSGERTVLVARGASENLSATKVPWGKAAGRWYYVTSLGGNLAFGRALFAHAARVGGRVFWNPGTKDLAHGAAKLRPMLRDLAVLDVNREEAAILTGKRPSDLAAMLRALADLCGGMTLLTDGPKGAYLAEGRHVWRVVGHPGVKSVNRTGAGDAFGSGFLAGLLRYRGDRVRALQLGTLNAEGVIRKIGAKAGLLAAWPSAAALRSVRVRPR